MKLGNQPPPPPPLLKQNTLMSGTIPIDHARFEQTPLSFALANHVPLIDVGQLPVLLEEGLNIIRRHHLSRLQRQLPHLLGKLSTVHHVMLCFFR